MTNKPKGVLFDVDGTLCDTNYLHAVAWSRALLEVGEYAPMATIHHHIGMGSDQWLEAVIGHDSEAAEDAHSKHFEAFADDVNAFPGTADLLRATAELGLKVVLASSAGPSTFKQLRQAIDADDVIDAATSAGDVGSSKPAPDIFEVAMQSAELEPANCIVVGDTVWDIQAAERAGLKCVAVLTGGISTEVLTGAGAIAVYESPKALLDQLNDSPIGELAAR